MAVGLWQHWLYRREIRKTVSRMQLMASASYANSRFCRPLTVQPVVKPINSLEREREILHGGFRQGRPEKFWLDKNLSEARKLRIKFEEVTMRASQPSLNVCLCSLGAGKGKVWEKILKMQKIWDGQILLNPSSWIQPHQLHTLKKSW